MKKTRKYINVGPFSKGLIVLSLTVIILLSFYWNFGLKSIEFASIPVELGTVSISIDPIFLFALTMVLCFYIGYSIYSSKKPEQVLRRQVIESAREIAVKYMLVLMLGGIGAWALYTEFDEAYIWVYSYPAYVQISETSQALRINGIIALLLLIVWLVIIKVSPSEVEVEPKTGKSKKMAPTSFILYSDQSSNARDKS